MGEAVADAVMPGRMRSEKWGDEVSDKVWGQSGRQRTFLRCCERRPFTIQKTCVLFLTAGVLVLEGPPANAANIYIAPDGRTSGKGTVKRPYDLATVLRGNAGRPGDTFWLREGIYHIGQADTEIHGERGRPITLRGMPGERVQLVGSLGIGGQKGYLIFRDFELYSGVERRVSKETGAGFNPKDIPHFTEGIQVSAPNISFINLVVHDSVRSAFYTASEATNVLIYGCIVYNTGWASPDNAEGHSYYLQAAGEISENIACNSTGAGFHVYASAPRESVRNMTLTGNIAWGAGDLQKVRPYRDWIVGVDSPALMADNIVLQYNMGYLVTNATTLPEVQLGRENTNSSLVLVSNYWPQGVTIGHWSKVVGAEGSRGTGRSKGTKIFVRPNRYESGRANIVVYNWDKLNTVSVNVNGVIPEGAEYEVRNAQDFYGQPVLCGRFDGQPLELPMNGLTTAKPMAGGLQIPAATGPTFNVFVLLPSARKNP